MPHFFINSDVFENNTVTISDKENYNHIVKSLRAKIGEKILMIDESQTQYEGVIRKIISNSIEIEVIKNYKSNRYLDFKLYLAQSPLRSDAQNFIIEKATELGVDGIYPIYTDNCALKKSVIEQKIPKWQKTMFEASKQCERAYVPKCFEITTIQDVIKQNEYDRVLAFTERSADFNLKEYLTKNPVKKNEKIIVIIGPEGGFSPKEFELFKKNKITKISLGNLILKAETAVIAAIAGLVQL